VQCELHQDLISCTDFYRFFSGFITRYNNRCDAFVICNLSDIFYFCHRAFKVHKWPARDSPGLVKDLHHNQFLRKGYLLYRGAFLPDSKLSSAAELIEPEPVRQKMCHRRESLKMKADKAFRKQKNGLFLSLKLFLQRFPEEVVKMLSFFHARCPETSRPVIEAV